VVKKKNCISIILFILACTLILSIKFIQAPVHATDDHSQLTKQLDQVIQQDPALSGALAGVSIRSQSTGNILYQHMGEARLRPASNMKLLTAAASLSILGKDYRFETEVKTDGVVNGKRLQGNLYLIGKGNPTLLPADFDKLAARLKKKGLTVIQGDLIGDDSWYDDVRYSIDLPWSDEDEYYGAAISALTAAPNTDYDAGTVIVDVNPGRKTGSKSETLLTPKTDVITVKNNATTVASDRETAITIHRKHHTNTIFIEGTIAKNEHTIRQWVAVQHPTKYALDLFKQSLIKNGIKIKGEVKTGVTPPNSQLLTTHESMPLSKMMIPLMKLSNNGHAEILVKEMGRIIKGDGSWNKGLEVMQAELSKLGVNTDTLILRDGSGISHVNAVPANEITKLLFNIQDQPWFSTYAQALPVAGKDKRLIGGTLRYRLKNLPPQSKVTAKTGTISTVSSLSGYVEAKSGKRYIFSIILNNLMDEERGKDVEDKIVTILANQ
jgi:D-alanyl-D-alanine carboxypeptidase/D-alanyl-D-alanine-endopeptidase (penicillin-binding protein 4)